MLKKTAKISLMIVSVVSLGACERGSKEGAGTLFGALAGAALGAAVSSGHHGRYGRHRGPDGFAVVAGAMMGAAVGNSIGRSLDNADRRAMRVSHQYALESSPSGRTSRWSNPDSGNYGTYTPQPAEENRDGRYCREYQQTITVGGKTENAYGKACRQPDGAWKIVSAD